MADQNTEKYYSARAAEYEQIYYRDNPERRKEIDDEVVRLKQLVADRDALELACGTGYWTQAMSQTARSITAIDVSSAMLDEARRKEYRCPVEFVRGDMFGYDYGRRYGALVIGFWFSHQPKQEYTHLFDLMRSLISVEGKIWLIDNNPPAEGPTQHSARKDENGNNFKKRFLDDGTEFVILKNYFSEDELRRVFSTEFAMESLIYGVYYWSAVLTIK